MQDSITVRTPAKINLSLDIIGKRNDGYHFLKTIMQAVSIFDTISIRKNDTDEINVFCSNGEIPCDCRNLAHKGAMAFFKHTKIKPIGLDISIEKEIPQLAGLAGGSSNAAGTIVALNELFELGLGIDELCDIGSQVGSDIPFCIMGGTTLAEGVGDILSSMPKLPDCYIVVVKPDIDVSTAQAFEKFDSLDVPVVSQLDDIIAALVVEDLEAVCSLLFNAFEYASDIEDIKVLKEEILSFGALGAIMTGSGSAVYGIFDKKKNALKCEEKLSEKYSFSKLCTPYAGGAHIYNHDYVTRR